MQPSRNGKASRFRTELITFPDSDDWWEIRAMPNLPLFREFSDIALQTQEMLKPDFNNPELTATLAKRNDALLVRATTAWSYGEVTEEVLHTEVPVSDYYRVGERLAALYLPLVLARIEASLSSSSFPSSPEGAAPSPTSSSKPT